MPTENAATAPNRHVDAANGVTYRYRRFGTPTDSGTPLIFLQHYRGTLDNWDPLLVDTIAAQREVILVDNAGIAGSTGTTPSTVEEMARDALAFLDALKITRYDLLGFSLGGFIAQEVTLRRPWQVRRVVLAGTGPQGGRGMHLFIPEVLEIALKDASTPEDILTLFFEHSASSRAKGTAFLERLRQHTADRDADSTLATRDAQLTAISTWGIPDETRLPRLAGIHQPVLVANGDNDLMVPTQNSYLLADHLPNAKLSIYPDPARGLLLQYPVKIGNEVNAFLGAGDGAPPRPRTPAGGGASRGHLAVGSAE